MELASATTEKVKFRSKKKTNWDGYRADLTKKLAMPMAQISSKQNLDHEADILTKAINDSYHNNCKLIYKNSKSIMKWHSGELLKLKKEVRRLHNLSTRLKTDDAWKKFREKRNEYKTKCNKATFDCWCRTAIVANELILL
jgi:hypothetical protein